MLTEKEKILLRHLRKNSRKSLTRISREEGIPVSTLFETLKRLEQKAVKRHVSLIDFSKLGYGFKVNFAIGSKNKKDLKDFLINSGYVNSLYSLISGHDFYAECIFPSLKKLTEFKEDIDQFFITSIEENFIVEEIKKEDFIL